MMLQKSLTLTFLGMFIMLTACSPRSDVTVPAGRIESAPKGGYADVVIRDTAVYTLNEEQPWAQALAIRDGNIVMVGSSAEAEAWAGPNSRIISQPGGMVLPGFQDAHIHAVSAGVGHFDCNLDVKPQTQSALLEKIRECAKTIPEGDWLSGSGWWLSAFPPSGVPDKSLLDAVSTDHPMMFYSVDGHSIWTNSLAMKIAGITAQTPDPPNGRIDRDPASGEPVGGFQEAAMALIDVHLPPVSQERIDAGLHYAIGYLHSLGITGMVQASASIDPEESMHVLPTLQRFAKSGELQLRTAVSLLWDNDKGLEQIPALLEARGRFREDLLNTNSVKFFLDGVIEPRTAALLQDYADWPGHRGELQVAPDLLNEAVARLDAEGLQLHFHVMGDAAVRAALDALQFALERNGPTDGRHHLAHVELVDPADIPRFAALNATANFSALWAYEDGYQTELTLPRVGPERFRWIYPINSILQAGGRIAFGSDWAVSSPEPLLAIETSVTRINPWTGNTTVFIPRERITLAQAIAAATLNAAWVNHLDDRTGSIEIGKLGDLVILDTNLFEIDPSAISDAKVVATLFGGEVVYHRADL